MSASPTAFTVTLSTGPIVIEADTHRVEGRHHVFRRTALVMGAPRLVVVRRLSLNDVLAVSP